METLDITLFKNKSIPTVRDNAPALDGHERPFGNNPNRACTRYRPGKMLRRRKRRKAARIARRRNRV
jgi:hypothetical protein